MESRFNEKARSALSFAHETAIRLLHDYVGTEDLLLGILKEGTSKAYEALSDQGITYEGFIEMLSPSDLNNDNTYQNRNIPMTPRSKTILEGTISDSGKSDPCDRCH